MSEVRFEKVRKAYGRVTALKEMDLVVHEGEFLTLLGPSGCGKTTTLRLVAGFVEATSGKILIDGEDVTRLPPQHRSIGMVFQDYALFPHMTIAQNIGFGLRERRVPADKVEARVKELLDLIQLPGYGSRYPAEISGGQQQRVALARAVAYTPRVLLMDEPLGALDLKLREAMQIEIRRIQRELRITTIYVTHDQSEAMIMSDRIAVMNDGAIAQLGTAEEIYVRPNNKFVADFIGKINLLPARLLAVNGTLATIEGGGSQFSAPASSVISGDGALIAAIRPEHLRFGQADTERNVLTGVIVARTFSGNLVHAVLRLPSGDELTVETRPTDPVPLEGTTATVTWQPSETLLLTEE